MKKRIWPRSTGRMLGLVMVLAGSTLLTGCLDDDDSSSSGQAAQNPLLFPEDGELRATIRRTTGGVPHITADDLKSAAFGHGYAQAQDNVCMLAEAVVKARSERSKYFGPGPDTQIGVGLNIINDFSYKAQKIYSGAEAAYSNLSAESKALVEGFAEGYNRYVMETAPGDLPAECRDQEWVKPISPIDLLAHYRVVGQYASGALFATGAVFLAVPPGVSPAPRPATPVTGVQGKALEKLQAELVATARAGAGSVRNFSDMGLASNAWGIGKNMTEQGRGALLANPHFPYTGHRRLYEVQMTVPGYLNVHGAGLLGTAIPLINFNENLAWSHTVTTSRRFTWYELALKNGDDLTYVKDGVEKPITVETYQVEVDMGMAEPVVLEREFYFSEYGPMIAANAVSGLLPAWGDAGALNGVPAAYTYRDANANTGGLLDTWLQMSRASNLEEFQQVFRNCGSTLWTNTTYADDQGNAFYIDSSSVPNLSGKAIALVNLRRAASAAYAGLFDQGVTLLDGSKSIDDWVETECGPLVPYAQKPKLVRSDWVQNSNSSYWATNPAEFLTGYSPLFGEEKAPINPRTRLGLKMLQNPTDPGFPGAPAPAGQDGKFSAEELIGVIWNNRAWYAEQFLPELLERCDAIGNTPVNGVDLSTWCAALASWDGLYNLDSVGAHIFRVFMANYRNDLDSDLTTPFSPADPVGTPADPSPENAGTASDTMLLALADGVQALQSQGIQPDAKLGDVQYYRASGGVAPGSGNTPVFLTQPIPWHGGDGNIDGAFNAVGVVTDPFLEDTRFPRIAPTTIPDTAGLSDGTDGINGWLMARGTSWHFGLEFTDNGPQAYGLVSYSQSTDAMSPYFSDQSELFSGKQYRPLPFTEQDIEANLLPQGETVISTQ